jgi:hypothetical protein
MNNSELKVLIINQICYEVDFEKFWQLEFWTWLIWALGLCSV